MSGWQKIRTLIRNIDKPGKKKHDLLQKLNIGMDNVKKCVQMLLEAIFNIYCEDTYVYAI